MTEGLQIFTSDPHNYSVKINDKESCELREMKGLVPVGPDDVVKIHRCSSLLQLYAVNTIPNQILRCEIYDEDTWGGQRSIVRFIRTNEYVWMNPRDAKMTVMQDFNDPDLLRDADGHVIELQSKYTGAYFRLIFEEDKDIGKITAEELFMECKRVHKKHPDWHNIQIADQVRHNIKTGAVDTAPKSEERWQNDATFRERVLDEREADINAIMMGAAERKFQKKKET